MYELPTEIKIESDVLHIRKEGDFRMVLDCFNALQDLELEDSYRIVTAVLIFYEEFSDISDVSAYPYLQEAVDKMFDFFNCGEPTVQNGHDYKLIDWEKDSQLICSAINNVVKKEIRNEPYVHWWTFMGYYNAVGECALSTIVSIRKKIAEHKKLEKYESDFKKDNPQYFTVDLRTTSQKETDNLLSELWNTAERR